MKVSKEFAVENPLNASFSEPIGDNQLDESFNKLRVRSKLPGVVSIAKIPTPQALCTTVIKLCCCVWF
jgi:hypothetical protein